MNTFIVHEMYILVIVLFLSAVVSLALSFPADMTVWSAQYAPGPTSFLSFVSQPSITVPSTLK